MNVAKFFLIYRTVRHLKIIQIIYLIYYGCLKKFGVYHKVKIQKAPDSRIQPITDPVEMPAAFGRGNCFTFLNLSHCFGDMIDWNFSGYGKLWTYQLNYFEFLNQPGMSKDEGLKIIKDFCRQVDHSIDGFEPYCISLRTIQWIKFTSVHTLDDAAIRDVTYSQIALLKRRLEFHILANHLLENALALTAAAYYFGDQKLRNDSWRLLCQQLDEQILPDGCHYERSPMYQLILANRVLDVLNIVDHYGSGNTTDPVSDGLRACASKMIGWLNAVQVRGTLPAFQDSTNVIPFSLERLVKYAASLNVNTVSIPPVASGYRVMEDKSMKVIFDVGSPQPPYQPGHAHAGALSWVLFYHSSPIVVDPGISTYEANTTRIREKGTNYHNTVQIGGRDQSEVWGSFRMGRRAKTTITVDTPEVVEAHHDGFKDLGVIHKRRIAIVPSGLEIFDSLINGPPGSGVFLLHFHPDCFVQVQNKGLQVDNLSFAFDRPVGILLEPYYFADDFNRTREGTRAVIPIETALRMTVVGKEKK